MPRTRDERFADRVDALAGNRERAFGSASFNDFLQMASYSHNGNTYTLPVTTTMGERRQEPIGNDFVSYVQGAYKSNGIVAACILARASVFSEVRFKFRNLDTKELSGPPRLRPLERPAENQTTGELLTRMEQDVSLAGNWYGLLRPNGVIRRLRPDWVEIVLGSNLDRDNPGWALDCEVAGYVYTPGGRAAMLAGDAEPEFLGVDVVAHWSPIPDPEANFRGMSWLTPVLAEITSDKAATDHKQRFFENAATPNMVLTAPEWVTSQDQFDQFKAAIDERNTGAANAYRNLYLAHGSDARVVGADMRQLDFKQTQGAGETRIAAAARVPAVLLGITEGLQGSSLNQGNYGMARRQFADGFLRPQWRSAAATLEKFVRPPAGSELWYDESDVAFLYEDAQDAANIVSTNAQAIRTLVDGGFEPDTVTEAVQSGDLTKLEHSGLPSVQVQEAPPASPPDSTPDDAPPAVVDDEDAPEGETEDE